MRDWRDRRRKTRDKETDGNIDGERKGGSVGRKRECVSIRNVQCVRVRAWVKERDPNKGERGWYTRERVVYYGLMTSGIMVISLFHALAWESANGFINTHTLWRALKTRSHPS